MTQEEYYKILKEKHAKTDWNNLQSIKQYNEFARQLRKILESERDKNENNK